MSEVMISESIVESEWILKGYWTKMRFAYQTAKSGWSDVDILAYHPEKKHLVISESKVRGPKKDIYAYTEHTKNEYGNILDYDGNNYFSFLDKLPEICSDGIVFTNFSKMVKKLTIQLVSNYVIDETLKDESEKTVLDRVKETIPNIETKVNVLLDSTMDVISRVVGLENEQGQGRRYGHPMLDIAREINRYSKPNIRYAGKGKEKTLPIKEQAIKSLANVIGLSAT